MKSMLKHFEDVNFYLHIQRNVAVIQINDVKILSIISLIAGITSLSLGVLSFCRVVIPFMEEHIIQKVEKKYKKNELNYVPISQETNTLS